MAWYVTSPLRTIDPHTEQIDEFEFSENVQPGRWIHVAVFGCGDWVKDVGYSKFRVQSWRVNLKDRTTNEERGEVRVEEFSTRGAALEWAESQINALRQEIKNGSPWVDWRSVPQGA